MRQEGTDNKEWLSSTPKQTMKDVREAIKWAKNNPTESGFERETYPVLQSNYCIFRAGLQTVDWYVQTAFDEEESALQRGLEAGRFIEGRVRGVVHSHNFGVCVTVNRHVVWNDTIAAQQEEMARLRKEVFKND